MVSFGTPETKHEHDWDYESTVEVETAMEGKTLAHPCRGCSVTKVIEDQITPEMMGLLEEELGAVEIATYENKPEYILIAAVREDPHAFDGMWYPTALSEDGVAMLAAEDPERFDSENLFFIRVTTDFEA